MPGMFDDFAIAPDLTARFYPTRPGSGRRLTDASGEACWIDLMGWNSKAAQDFRYAREDRLRRLGREMTAQELYDDMGAMLATMTVAWNLIAPTGRRLDVECNHDNAVSLFNSIDQRWLRQQAVDFLNNEGNFVPPGWRS